MSQANQGVSGSIERAITERVDDGEDRLQKLLRDIWYAGPIQRGSSPYRGARDGEGSPGSGLRRSRDGALWGLPDHEEDAVLEAAIEAGLIRKDDGLYSTTAKGRQAVAKVNVCGECGCQCEPHHRTEQVTVGSTTQTNHSLVTKCPECSGGWAEWERDAFPATRADEDAAERYARSFEGVKLYDAGDGEWQEPHQRALDDFIEIVKEEVHDVERFWTRYSTPTQLRGAKEAFQTVFDMYTEKVCEKFADLLLDTYYGQSLSTLEQAIVEQIAAGYPERERGKETHHAEYGEPIAATPDVHWEATIKTIASDEYVTINGGTEKAKGSFQHETKSGAFKINFSDYGRKNIFVYGYGDDLFHIGTMVNFEVQDRGGYSSKTRVEQAVEVVKNHVENSNEPGTRSGQRVFCKLANGEGIKKRGLGSRGMVNLELNTTEIIKTARVVRMKLPEKEVPGIVERYAEKSLK